MPPLSSLLSPFFYVSPFFPFLSPTALTVAFALSYSPPSLPLSPTPLFFPFLLTLPLGPMHCEWIGALGDLETHFAHCEKSRPIPSAPPAISPPPSTSLSSASPHPSAYDDPSLFPPVVKDKPVSAPPTPVSAPASNTVRFLIYSSIF
jgi:hypothetical protein